MARCRPACDGQDIKLNSPFQKQEICFSARVIYILYCLTFKHFEKLKLQQAKFPQLLSYLYLILALYLPTYGLNLET